MPSLGSWHEDAEGLPLYVYTGAYPVRALDRQGRDSQQPEDPCFLLGNYRLTVFAHASGTCQLITGERGWARLNQGAKNCGWNRTQLRVLPACDPASLPVTHPPVTHLLAGPGSDPALVLAQAFGVGYARSTFHCPAADCSALTVTRTLAVKPSPAIHQGNPSVLITATLANPGPTAVTAHYREELLARHVMMNDQELSPAEQRVEYRKHLHVTPAHHLASAQFVFHPVKLLVPPESTADAYTHDIAPPLLFLHAVPALGTDQRLETRHEEYLGDLLCAQTTLTLAPGESRTLRFVLGLAFDHASDDALAAQISDLLNSAHPRPDAGPFSSLWAARLPDLSAEPDPILRREMLWNAYSLEALATYHRYFDETFVPQGSVYAFHQGFNASTRDHLQHALPLMFTHPALAKSCLRHALKHTLHDGELKRQNIGFGYSEPGVYMESDPQLYFFMAVAEYLRITGDTAFLDETVDYYPRETRRTDTVLTFLAKLFVYLRDTVGTGRHGLVKMLNSDWSDSFFHRLSPNLHRLWAESHINSTMVLAVFPPLLRELRRAAPAVQNRPLAERLIAGLDHYSTAIHAAVLRDLEGRTFAARCYVGEHDEPAFNFGVHHLCVEAQPYLLQAENFPVERKRRLYAEIRARVLDRENYGARTREVPIHDPEGKGEDGGIWWAHQGPLILGLATFDRPAALRLLRSLTFHAFAEHYPDYWVGHWTSADSVESTLSPREGLYHFWLPDAFQPYCAHPHAWMLYCYLKLSAQSVPATP